MCVSGQDKVWLSMKIYETKKIPSHVYKIIFKKCIRIPLSNIKYENLSTEKNTSSSLYDPGKKCFTMII